MSNNAHDLSKRLLNALDSDYNVVDMHTVNDIISILEKLNITKELLETTRLGKHVNELRRKTSDPALARRAKVLVKRWRDLVIPGATASPAHASLPGSNRSSAERQTRRLGGTPLTSPALIRQVVSPAVPSPRPLSRPTWGGYESDSQDVILVDDDPPPAPPPPAPVTPSKRPPSPPSLVDDQKAKRDKKPKKKRGHSRAGSSGLCNGSRSPPRRNGCHIDTLVHRMPPAGTKKVKTTKELLEDIQNRGGGRAASPEGSAGSPDVQVIEPDDIPLPEKVSSPARNGVSPVRSPLPPLEDPREEVVCTCGDEEDLSCAGARGGVRGLSALHLSALHHLYLPGVNGTRAPPRPHQYAHRHVAHPDTDGLFSSVVPLYKYQDYADDSCVKNMYRVPLCTHLPPNQLPPAPPSPPPLPPPPSPRPYPLSPARDDEPAAPSPSIMDISYIETELVTFPCPTIEPEMVSIPKLEPSERLKAPLLTDEDETLVQRKRSEKAEVMEVVMEFKEEPQHHRTVPKTKERFQMDGRTLYGLCDKVRSSIPYEYSQTSSPAVVTLPQNADEVAEVVVATLAGTDGACERDALGRPQRPSNFAEWHECAQLGDLIALPYVVID